MSWKKLIPAKIKITSLYWIEKEEILDKDLSLLFRFIDEDNYSSARRILSAIKRRWNDQLVNAPQDFTIKYFHETAKAESMLDFLDSPLT